MRYYSSSVDFYYETTASTLNYYISVGGETIYSGKAVASPSSGKVSVNIGKRVRDYIRISMPDFRYYDGVIVPHPEAMLVFNLCDSQSGNILEQYNVRLDETKEWSGEEGCLSEPINTHADPRQKIFYGHTSSGETSVDIESYVPNPKIIFEDRFYFDWESGVTTICYTANTDFTLSSYEGGWFSVTQSKADEYTGCLTFTYTENDGRNSRDGVLCMQAAGGYVECFPVVQAYYTNGYATQYLTFDILSGGTIVLGPVQRLPYIASPVSYSIDDGNTWTTFGLSYDNSYTINVSAGDKILWKGEGSFSERRFTESTAVFNVEGNIMSMLWGDDFIRKDFPKWANNDCFEYCFTGAKVVNADNLIIPLEGAVYGDETHRVEGGYFEGMFSGCTMLVSAPQELRFWCNNGKGHYRYMFEGCTSLVKGPAYVEYPGRTGGCLSMFERCISLVTPPEIYVGDFVNDSAFSGMFRNCTSLSRPAIIHSNRALTEIGSYAFSGMFNGCPFVDVDIFYDANSSTRYGAGVFCGTFANCANLKTCFDLPYFENIPDAFFSSMFSNCVSMTEPPVMPSAATIGNSSYSSMFSGCISLVVQPTISGLTSLGSSACKEMFKGCTSLQSTLVFPNATLGSYCYEGMYKNCTSLTNINYPYGSAEGYCKEMFAGCTSLTRSISLSGTAPHAYEGMFKGCTSLTYAYSVNADGSFSCQNMFEGCVSLTSVSFSTRVGEGGCREMFKGCTSLVYANNISVTSVGDYGCYRMFAGCTSLQTSPNLAADKLNVQSYAYMFDDCANLRSIRCLATEKKVDKAPTFQWIRSVTNRTGTFTKKSGVNWSTTGSGSYYNGVPVGWTITEVQ